MIRTCPVCHQHSIDSDALEKARNTVGFECLSCHSRVMFYPLLDVARYIFIHFTGVIALLLFVLDHVFIAIALLMAILLAAYSLVRIWPIKVLYADGSI